MPGVVALRLAFGLALLGAWQLAGSASSSIWISTPSEIAPRLVELISGPLWPHFGISLAEMLVGLAIGVPLGVLVGLILGYWRIVANLTRPLVISFYALPSVALAPILILWFGLDMAPKVFLVAKVSFFLFLFNTFSGVLAIDRDLVQSMQLMGSSTREVFQKVIIPACGSWIATAFKLALPYALVATTVGEVMASRKGLGYLLTRATNQIDIPGMYAVLVVLMVLGLLLGQGSIWLERALSGRQDRSQ